MEPCIKQKTNLKTSNRADQTIEAPSDEPIADLASEPVSAEPITVKKGGMQGSFVQIYGYALYELQRDGLLPGGR